MAQGDTPITIVGNLVEDPTLRYTPSGTPVANFRVASTPRWFDSKANQWTDGDPLFLGCNAWRQTAENAANSLSKGDRVIVTGTLRQRRYETEQGEKRSVYEIKVDEVGPSLKYATTQVTRTPRNNSNNPNYAGQTQGNNYAGNNSNNSGNNQTSGAPGGQGSFGGWSGATDDDPWSSAPEAGGGFDDGSEPPF
ncbi:single-stranded DNA-binding protein [Corynebacterium glyciniphilum]|uniref:single-stranded DNA-binding protein n=1 Tax=Corynebacterium glyciniphilum TaxID=1404244 RepID=UPI0011AB70BB|nr:single-stranded DNA-binding protein [Corynebacterium glyciniphilum]